MCSVVLREEDSCYLAYVIAFPMENKSVHEVGLWLRDEVGFNEDNVDIFKSELDFFAS